MLKEMITQSNACCGEVKEPFAVNIRGVNRGIDMVP
jgi:hypothetical protein